ncbi:hypothetical protein HDV02_006557 [Globomyces sp. JEL0801]|nr:hypothetical protein HDV02_006557 [Globomyces sp. JEL0801]
MPKSYSTSSDTSEENLKRRKHLDVERRRRRRIQDQLDLLKRIVPNCSVRDDKEKLQILQSTAQYIEDIQQLLSDLVEERPSLSPRIQKYLPIKMAPPTILSLLPSYRPPAALKQYMDSTMHGKALQDNQSSSDTEKHTTDLEIEDYESISSKQAMSLSNLLC